MVNKKNFNTSKNDKLSDLESGLMPLDIMIEKAEDAFYHEAEKPSDYNLSHNEILENYQEFN